jgi:Ca2+-binding EF-hand superfamily protein
MGHKESKEVFNFEQYGLSQNDAEMLENCFNHAVGKHHTLKHDKFVELYLNLYPETNEESAQQMADHAFNIADQNHNGYLSFEEFAKFFLRYRSQNTDVYKNISNFLNNFNNNGFITKDQAEKCLNFANDCFGYKESSVVSIEEILKYFDDSYGDQIPADIFLDQVTPIFTKNHTNDEN